MIISNCAICKSKVQKQAAAAASFISSEPNSFFFINVNIVELHVSFHYFQFYVAYIARYVVIDVEQPPCATESVQLLVEHNYINHDISYMMDQEMGITVEAGTSDTYSLLLLSISKIE